VIDLHCHVLPGIDDGPSTVPESLALARAAAAAGTRTIVATPHVSWRYPNRAETIASLVGELNARLAAEGIAIDVREGAEIALTRIADIEPAELERLTLGDGEWLLVEPPFLPTAYGLDASVFALQRQGHHVVLAHPERCPAFHRGPRALAALVSAGTLTSITAGSLAGRFGKQVRRFAMQMVAEGLVHNVASDAHDIHRRPPSIATELAHAGLGGQVDWLTQQVPAAILAGTEIPPRPPTHAPIGPGRRRWPWRGVLRSS